ncbi:MAG: transglutaminase family protein [Actinomycetota bacterium]
MTIRVALEHTTTYEFDRSVNLGPHVIRLRPGPQTRTEIDAYSLRVEPAEHFLNWQQDPFGNFEARLVFPEKTRRLEVVVDLVAQMTSINPFDFFLEDEAETFPFTYDAHLKRDLAPYLATPEPDRLFARWLTGIDRTPRRTIEYLVDLNQRVNTDVGYTIRLEPGTQEPEETLTTGTGSCRDSAWLLVQALRHEGLAARFVSGYLVQLTADEVPLDGPAGPTEDFTDLHAWAEVFLPGAGWVGLDPTSGLFAAEGHLPLAATPSPGTAAPISGALDECEVEFSFSNTVRRIHEDPRVTKPYDDEQWQAIDRLGLHIDKRLTAGDVRLTMGGEPTFVSIDDFESSEWNTHADGLNKKRMASTLMGRLRKRFGPGGVVHHGQGKWYPGEPLPRWQQALVWRRDGQALWREPELLADPALVGLSDSAVVERFTNLLAARLGLVDETIRPAWEDPLHALWQEAQLPLGPVPDEDLDPSDPELFTEHARRALTARLDAMAGSPAGWVLPLHRSTDGASWATSRWATRRNQLFLMPGDSAMGYRLPIPSLAWDAPPPPFEPSPFAQLRALPDRSAFPRRGGGQRRGIDGEVTIDGPAGGGAVAPGGGAVAPSGGAVGPSGGPPTALCAELRNGQIHVFLPPLVDAADTVDLLAAIEDVADAVDRPVVIEGYPIPSDPRLDRLVVAPDPGVIEVNVPPARDWGELRSIVEGVYDDAHSVRLGTETFDLDGTHSGTGGGNHVTIGGPTAADSPLLRRPDLLRSLITYWQHHPSLSYVFSGRFIGPSSQAPRVDEARDDNLFELETAFAEMDRHGPDVPPWLVDRLLRHLLVDQTGNTHRSEICIDKLFSPDSERGRMGLAELRAFEMPPHPRMALVQNLLVRSLVARCWDEPFQQPLVRWGTSLHDRYLLPWYLERDLHAVTEDLNRAGIDFEPAWFDPFIEFRFPRHGTAQVDGLNLEVRGAIEPWHVLGEEATGSGMARYVDSSVERVQLRVDGFAPERHVVTCNGVAVPLTPTDVAGVAVAGIRYKAWQPPSGMHPTIGIDSPLTFDVIDTVAGRSVGGCRYHVVHPGGLSYDSRPVNAAEADSRRQNRFEVLGHSPGDVQPDVMYAVQHREYPHTLDLRRVDRTPGV